jgi:hypothetical protein
MDWFDPILLGFAALIVFPDYFLNWLSDTTGKAFNLLHLIALEVMALAGLTVFMVLVMPHKPKLLWWHPAVFVSVLTGFG